MKRFPKYSITFALGITMFGFAETNAKDWIRASGIDSIDVTSIIQSGDAFYATTPTTIFKSTAQDASWQPTSSQPAITNEIYKLFAHNNIVYAGTSRDGIFQSDNDGVTWQNIKSGLPGGASGSISGFAAIGDNIYAGTDGAGVYVRNVSASLSWTSYNTGLFQLGVTTIAASGNTLAAGAGLYLFMRPAASTEWTTVNVDTFLQYEFFSLLPIDQYLFTGTNRGIYRGSIDGQNWQKTDISTFPNQDITAFAKNGNEIFAAVSRGNEHWIFTSEDYGANWEIHAHEFAFLWCLFVANGKLWAGRSDGLWYFDLDNLTRVNSPGAQAPDIFQLYQNYPNPFNQTTTINFELRVGTQIELNLYNLFGQKIQNLFKGFQTAGFHRCQLNASDLNSGIYFYELKADNSVQRKRLLLIK